VIPVQPGSTAPAPTAGPRPVITPQTGTVGATVTNIDLRVEQSTVARRVLERALHEHGVLFVPFDGEIQDSDHKRFAAIFGNLHESYFNRGSDDPFISVLDSERTGSPSYGTDQWHTDVSLVDKPPQAASLRARVLPQTGGDTMWAGMYAAYEALSSHYQRLLEGLEALHSSEALYRARPAAREANLYGEDKRAVHPVVVRDPLTRRPALYVNSGYTERILGLTDHENTSLLQMLFEHVNSPDFHVRLKWDTNTVVIWEERVTQHRAINDYTGRRVLHRIVVDGDKPEAYSRSENGAAER
jgi:taurine dioxygenase